MTTRYLSTAPNAPTLGEVLWFTSSQNIPLSALVAAYDYDIQFEWSDEDDD
jgi:hypothetical protein